MSELAQIIAVGALALILVVIALSRIKNRISIITRFRDATIDLQATNESGTRPELHAAVEITGNVGDGARVSADAEGSSANRAGVVSVGGDVGGDADITVSSKK